jgi:hypothetical protein
MLHNGVELARGPAEDDMDISNLIRWRDEKPE